jgi:8-oxo-dGTP pyrophosphatase MutT (NUDIX family)
LPKYYVFPGGAVDALDGEGARTLMRGSAGACDPAFAFAAARETFEECGLLFADRRLEVPELVEARRDLLAGKTPFGELLRRLDVVVDAGAMRYFSRWITPPGEVRRFDARFFVARAPQEQVAEADAIEVHDGRWLAPHAALAAYERGEIQLIFPTIKHLERLAAFSTIDALFAFAETKPIVPVAPRVSGDRLFSIAPELDATW